MKKQSKRNYGTGRAILAGVTMLLLMVVGCDSATSPNTDLTNNNVPVTMDYGDRMNTGHDDASIYTVEGFYFLAPMVKGSDYSGTFDGGLSPVVEICETTACDGLHASFDMNGSGSEQVRVVEEDEHYIVNWSAKSSGAEAGQIYRVRVLVNGLILGHADVHVVSNGREAKQYQSEGEVAIVANQTLPVKFRIETGIVGEVVVTPAEATIEVGNTQQFTATLFDLRGNPFEGPAVNWSSESSDVASINTDGLATGVSVGDATLFATSGAATGSANLSVITPPAIQGPSLNQSVTDQNQLVLTIREGANATLEAIDFTILENLRIFQVSGGTFSGGTVTPDGTPTVIVSLEALDVSNPSFRYFVEITNSRSEVTTYGDIGVQSVDTDARTFTVLLDAGSGNKLTEIDLTGTTGLNASIIDGGFEFQSATILFESNGSDSFTFALKAVNDKNQVFDFGQLSLTWPAIGCPIPIISNAQSDESTFKDITIDAGFGTTLSSVKFVEFNTSTRFLDDLNATLIEGGLTAVTGDYIYEEGSAPTREAIFRLTDNGSGNTDDFTTRYFVEITNACGEVSFVN